jgi:hypothetical protein
MGHIRSHGVRHLLIYCSTGLCHHSAVVDADRWPDDAVLLDLCRKHWAGCARAPAAKADTRKPGVVTTANMTGDNGAIVSTAPDASLSFLFWGAGLFVLPVIGGYTAVVYWLFRGKQREGYNAASASPPPAYRDRDA